MKVSHNTECFFKYTYKGDGKYYTTEQGGKSYRNTSFQNFLNQNRDCIEILGKGNDAPKGGQTGNFVIVKFNEKFFDKWQKYINFLKEEQERVQRVTEAKAYCKELKISFWQGDKKLFNEAITKHPECNAIGDAKVTIDNIFKKLI